MVTTVKSRTAVYAVLLTLCLGATAPAWAQLTDDDILGARSEGMANAFHALAFDNSALDLNPAGMAQFPRLSVDIGYRINPTADASRFNVSIIDALSSKVAGGVGYAFETADTPDSGTKARSHKLVTGFGVPLVPEKLFFGFNTRYVRLNYPGDSELKDLKAFTFDTGFLARPVQFLAIGAAVNNIVDADRPELPLTVGGGIAALVPNPGGSPLAMIAGDVTADFASNDDTSVGWATGAQIAVTQSVWMRAGYSVDAASQDRGVSAGVSYVGDQWGIDYAVIIPTSGETPRHLLNVNLLVF